MPSTGPLAGGAQSSVRDSALALELEIERMRKMIREREEMKLRKQAVGGYQTLSLTRGITMYRWRQAGQRLSPGNRRRHREHSKGKVPVPVPRRGHHRARPRTRSRDLRPPTTKRPRMVRSFFSQLWESGSVSGASRIGGISRATGRQSRVSKKGHPLHPYLSRSTQPALAVVWRGVDCLPRPAQPPAAS